jgi:hypothetical protein
VKRLLLLVVAAVGCEEQAPLTRGLTAEEHAAYYPINVGDVHALGKASPDGPAPLSCTSCHSGGETFATSFCLRCHVFDAVPAAGSAAVPGRPLAEVHAEVASFRAEDASCLACHPDGVRGNAQDVPSGPAHSDVNFPIDLGDAHGPDDGGPYALSVARTPAADTTCSACHASVELARRNEALCFECHALDTQVDGGVDIGVAHGPLSPPPIAEQLRTSYELIRTGDAARTNVGCKECHAETPINPAVRSSPDAGPGLITPAHIAVAGIETNHHQATCWQCHQSRLPAPKEWAIDFQTSSCICCHEDLACTPDSPINVCTGSVTPPQCPPEGPILGAD